jgi:hypothetical protein
MKNSNIQVISHEEEAFVLMLDINDKVTRVFHITVDENDDGITMDHIEISLSDYYNLLRPGMECPEAGCVGELQKDKESDCLICLDCGFALPLNQ